MDNTKTNNHFFLTSILIVKFTLSPTIKHLNLEPDSQLPHNFQWAYLSKIGSTAQIKIMKQVVGKLIGIKSHNSDLILFSK